MRNLGRSTARFWEKVDRSCPARSEAGPCWVWVACLDNHGYGAFRLGRLRVRAHRVAYEVLVGPIPLNMTLDHLCRNRACCNPAHLEPVTRGENVLRGEGLFAQRARQVVCLRGHDNWRIKANGTRDCRTCHNERRRIGDR